MDNRGDQPISELERYRQSIAEIDADILRLMQQRIHLAKEVGAVKLANGLPVKDYRVEKDVVERNSAKAKEIGLYQSLAVEVSNLLIKYSVAAQDEFHQRSRSRVNSAQKKILIIGGAGKMGRWFANYFFSFGHEVRLCDIGEDSDVSDPRYTWISSWRSVCCEVDTIVLATPISVTSDLLRDLASSGTKALVFDIASLKSPLKEAIASARKGGLRVASIHPMFGPNVELLAGRNILICDTGDQSLVDEVQGLFRDTSAKIVKIALDDHDQLMAYVLGLSHIANLVFTEVLRNSAFDFDRLLEVGSTTFLSQLNIARAVSGENQQLYYQIQNSNPNSAEVYSKFIGAIDSFAQAVKLGNEQEFCRLMALGSRYLGQGN